MPALWRPPHATEYPMTQPERLKALLRKALPHCPPKLAAQIKAALSRARGAAPAVDDARVRRMALTMSQSEIARKLGVSRQAISRRLGGKGD